MIGSTVPLEAARALVVAELASRRDDLVVLDDRTIERPRFWVFFATTRRHAETGDPGEMIPGLGPIAVMRDTGRVTALATSVPPNRAIAIFEAGLATSS